MIDVAAVLKEIEGLDSVELERWIEARWVLPERAAAGYAFHEVDVARIRLILELRHDLMIDEEAMPVVLNLLDQVYALRNRLKALAAAVGALPPEMRALLSAHLKD